MDAGQDRPLIEHVLKGADANGQIDRLIRDSSQLLGIIHLERKIGSARQASNTSARQFDHARRHIDPYATSYFGSKGGEVMAGAATDVQDDICGPGPAEASHKR